MRRNTDGQIPTDRRMLDQLRDAHDRGQHGDLTYWSGTCPDCAQAAILPA